MRVYRQDPSIYRYHFAQQTGGDLEGFKGARTHHGHGIGTLLGALARKAVPLIRAGFKLAAPHVKQAGKEIAKDFTKRAINKATEKMTQKMSGKGYKRSKGKRKCIKRKATKRARTKDIFS